MCCFRGEAERNDTVCWASASMLIFVAKMVYNDSTLRWSPALVDSRPYSRQSTPYHPVIAPKIQVCQSHMAFQTCPNMEHATDKSRPQESSPATSVILATQPASPRNESPKNLLPMFPASHLLTNVTTDNKGQLAGRADDLTAYCCGPFFAFCLGNL
jgi:hypothetical protein